MTNEPEVSKAEIAWVLIVFFMLVFLLSWAIYVLILSMTCDTITCNLFFCTCSVFHQENTISSQIIISQQETTSCFENGERINCSELNK
jgi:flagellar basal body-associated protein FliL